MGGRALSQHTPYKHTHIQLVQCLRRLSLENRLAEVKHTHIHTRALFVVSAAVKSHCSKESDMFDQRYKAAAKASGGAARAAICFCRL